MTTDEPYVQMCDDCRGRGWRDRQVGEFENMQEPCQTCGGQGSWIVEPVTPTPAVAQEEAR